VFELGAAGHLGVGIFWLAVAGVLIVVVLRVAANASAAARERERLRQLAQSTLQTIDRMTGVQFEEYVATRLRDAGYPVTTTPASGDFGVDLIVSNNRRRVAVQCKRLSRPVGVAAVQQVVAGALHYGCDTAMVISNQEYTPAARELAHTHDCILVGRSVIVSWNANSAVRHELACSIGQPVRDASPMPDGYAEDAPSGQRPLVTAAEGSVNPPRVPTAPRASTEPAVQLNKSAEPVAVDRSQFIQLLTRIEAEAADGSRRAERYLDEFTSHKGTFRRREKNAVFFGLPIELAEAASASAGIAILLRHLRAEVQVATEPPPDGSTDPPISSIENPHEGIGPESVDIVQYADVLAHIETQADDVVQRAKVCLDDLNNCTSLSAKMEIFVELPKELRMASATLSDIAEQLRAQMLDVAQDSA